MINQFRDDITSDWKHILEFGDALKYNNDTKLCSKTVLVYSYIL